MKPDESFTQLKNFDTQRNNLVQIQEKIENVEKNLEKNKNTKINAESNF